MAVSRRRKRLLIGIMSTRDLLKSRGQAIYETWLREIDPNLADVIFFAENDGDKRFRTVQLKNVNDNEYPPQRKSFSLALIIKIYWCWLSKNIYFVRAFTQYACLFSWLSNWKLWLVFSYRWRYSCPVEQPEWVSERASSSTKL